MAVDLAKKIKLFSMLSEASRSGGGKAFAFPEIFTEDEAFQAYYQEQQAIISERYAALCKSAAVEDAAIAQGNEEKYHPFLNAALYETVSAELVGSLKNLEDNMDFTEQEVANVILLYETIMAMLNDLKTDLSGGNFTEKDDERKLHGEISSIEESLQEFYEKFASSIGENKENNGEKFDIKKVPLQFPLQADRNLYILASLAREKFGSSFRVKLLEDKPEDIENHLFNATMTAIDFLQVSEELFGGKLIRLSPVSPSDLERELPSAKKQKTTDEAEQQPWTLSVVENAPQPRQEARVTTQYEQHVKRARAETAAQTETTQAETAQAETPQAKTAQAETAQAETPQTKKRAQETSVLSEKVMTQKQASMHPIEEMKEKGLIVEDKGKLMTKNGESVFLLERELQGSVEVVRFHGKTNEEMRNFTKNNAQEVSREILRSLDNSGLSAEKRREIDECLNAAIGHTGKILPREFQFDFIYQGARCVLGVKDRSKPNGSQFLPTEKVKSIAFEFEGKETNLESFLLQSATRAIVKLLLKEKEVDKAKNHVIDSTAYGDKFAERIKNELESETHDPDLITHYQKNEAVKGPIGGNWEPEVVESAEPEPPKRPKL